MSVGFGYFRFQGAMSSFKFCKMRFYGHPSQLRADIEGRLQPAEHPTRNVARRDTVKGVLGYRHAAGREFPGSVAFSTQRRILLTGKSLSLSKSCS
jgi:hypothetical protein